MTTFMPRLWLHRSLVLTVIALMHACSSVITSTTAPAADTTAVISTQPTVPAKPFAPDTLYELMVAEIAAQRGQYALTLQNYLKQAAKTRDPEVVARATHIAQFLQAEQAVLEASLLWVEVEPDNSDARFIAATQLARAKRPFDALTHMRVAHEMKGRTNFAMIAVSALSLPEADQKIMLGNIEDLLQTAPDTTDLLIAQAILQQSVVSKETALDTVQNLLDDHPGHTQALFIEASLIQQIDPQADAYQRIKIQLENEPDNRPLRQQYALTLAKADPEGAIAEFNILLTQYPDDPDILLPLAVLYAESQRWEEARSLLEQLLAQNQQTSTAHYYLGAIAQQQEALDQAVEHYKAVAPGQYFTTALQRIVAILDQQNQIEQAESWLQQLRERYPLAASQFYQLQAGLLLNHQRYTEAHKLLTDALTNDADNPTLLYSRSLVSEKLGNIELLESDLRQILKLDPNNVMALNALGYSLTNLTTRYAEALELIQQALTLKPEDPAIMDSMGWVHYRLGNHQKALEYLRKALERFPDQEVAAHLFEVLWVVGEVDQARAVYNEALAKTPDSELLQQTVQRLGIDSKLIRN